MSQTSKSVLEDPFRLALHEQADALIQDAIETLGGDPEHIQATYLESMLLLVGVVARRHPQHFADWLERLPKVSDGSRLADYADEVARALEA